MKWGLPAVFIVIALLMPAAAQAATVGVQSEQNTSAGVPLVVNITVDQVTGLYGFQFNLAYNSTVLQASSISTGPFLGNSNNTICMYKSISTPGLIDYFLCTRNATGSIDGAGVLATVTFAPNATGTSALTLSNVELSDINSNPIAKTVASGSVNVIICVDGQTDTCGSNIGVCEPGTRTCSGGSWGSCQGGNSLCGCDWDNAACINSCTEVCNNADDDCDGVVDDLSRECSVMHQGACAVGNEACTAGVWAGCPNATAEVGDGIDNNCDGQIDEGMTLNCTDYATCGTYEAPGPCPLPPAEQCDNQDNDCDGLVDDGFPCVAGESKVCGSNIGACESGTQTCANCSWSDCIGGVEPSDEVCADGIDNNCDGTVDETGCIAGTDIPCPQGPIPSTGCICGEGTYTYGYCCMGVYGLEPCVEFPWWLILIAAGVAILIVLFILVRKHGSNMTWEELYAKWGALIKPGTALLVMAFFSLALAGTAYAAQQAGDVNQDFKVDILDVNILRAGLGLTSGQIGFNPNTDLNNDSIINLYDLVSVGANFGAVYASCSDDTPIESCSGTKPIYCNVTLDLVNNCSHCGCASGYDCQANETCTTSAPSTCSDGTLPGDCSSTKPQYCNSGLNLVNNCTECGCPAGEICEADESCNPDPYAAWENHKTVTVTGSSSALTGYQLAIDLGSIRDNTGLVGSFHMNEGQGASISDSSGRGNNGELIVGGFTDEFSSGESWTENQISGGADNGNYIATLTSTGDPYFKRDVPNFDEASDHLEIRYMSYTNGPASIRMYYLDARDCGGWSETCAETFTITSDGSWHTLNVDVTDAEWVDNDGTITWLRFDFDGASVTGIVYIDYIMLSGDEWVDGVDGKALEFDGSDDYMRAGGFSDLGTSNQPYSFQGWFMADSGETDGNIIHTSRYSGGTGWCVSMVSLDNNKIKGHSYTGSGVSVHSTTTVSSGKWYHFANTWDPTNGLRIYVNGALEGAMPMSSYSASGAANYIHLARSGGSCTGSKGWFSGKIDEVRVYKKSLGPDDVKEEFCIGAERLLQQGEITQAEYDGYSCPTPKSYGYALDDLRLVDSGGTSLDYWLEGNNKAWVKPSIPTAGTTLRMHYGNPSVAGVSVSADSIFDPLGDYHLGWKEYKSTSCTGPTDWNRIGYDDSSWADVADVRSDSWSCDYCDIYLRKPIIVSEVGASSITVRSDDGQWVYVSDGVEVGHCGAGCHGGGICTRAWDITSKLTAGENVIAVYCSEGGGAEYCEVDSWSIPNTYARQYASPEPVATIS